MSTLVHFEDLVLLDGSDLRAVLGEVSLDLQAQAFLGVPNGFRHLLLTRLPSPTSHRLSEVISAYGPVREETSAAAQSAIIEALCRLGRNAQIAFDDPADMVW